MFVFQTAMIMILPLIIGINGIWMAVIAAELLALLVSIIFIIINRGKYGYV
jgi:Na+-driven multidrug efflux pump